MSRIIPLAERFAAKVDKSGQCWRWTGSRGANGYGNISQGPGTKKMLSAHRVAYQLVHGDIPAGLFIDHICRNKLCVNPDHLQAVTRKQNNENSRAVHASSGIRGVHWNKAAKKFEARARHNGKMHSAGHFTTKEEAAAAVIALRNTLHSNNLPDRQSA